jgi:hypothetical protein
MTDSKETRDEESEPVRKRQVIYLPDLPDNLPEGVRIDSRRVPWGKWHDPEGTSGGEEESG